MRYKTGNIMRQVPHYRLPPSHKILHFRDKLMLQVYNNMRWCYTIGCNKAGSSPPKHICSCYNLMYS